MSCYLSHVQETVVTVAWTVVLAFEDDWHMHLSKTVPILIPFQAILSETCMFSLCPSRFHLVCLGRENRS